MGPKETPGIVAALRSASEKAAYLRDECETGGDRAAESMEIEEAVFLAMLSGIFGAVHDLHADAADSIESLESEVARLSGEMN